MLGLTMDEKHKVFRKNKQIILVTEPEVIPAELFVCASPHAVDKAMKASHDIDEAKLKNLLHDLGIK